LVIYVLIVALIVAAVVVSGLGLGANAVYFNLLIAGAQAFLLSYFFMHLKEADSLTWIIAGAAIFWLVILFLFLLTDYVTRQIAAY
jgi:caa(3)-type oxidase subunit IV